MVIEVTVACKSELARESLGRLATKLYGLVIQLPHLLITGATWIYAVADS